MRRIGLRCERENVHLSRIFRRDHESLLTAQTMAPKSYVLQAMRDNE